MIEIATAFMSAPLEPGGWDMALRKMAQQTGSARGQLVAFGFHHAIPFNKVTDEPDDWAKDFDSIDGGNPAVNWRVACAREPLALVFEPDYEQARNRLKSDVYSDYARQHDIMHGCQTVLSQDSSIFFGLATLRTAADGATTEYERAVFAGVAPFALSAIKMQIALEHKGAQHVAEAFDGMNAIAFLLDARGKVAAQTSGAEGFLSQRNCPLRRSGDQLAAIRSGEQRTLQLAINQSLGALQAATPRIWFSGQSLYDGHVCEIFQMPRRDLSFGYEPRVLVIVQPMNRSKDAAAFLQHVMELTPAEAEVAKLIGDGMSREQVAERRKTSMSTVHAQLKSLYRKADVNREGELVALINRLLV